MKKILILLIPALLLNPLVVTQEHLTDGEVKGKWEESLLIAAIPFLKSSSYGLAKPSWKEVEEILPELKEIGVDIIFIWGPYKHRRPLPGETITVLTEKGEIELELGWCAYVQDYLMPDPERGTEEEFLHMIETAHSLGMKVIAQLQVTVTAPNSFVYDKHPEWILKSIYGSYAVEWPWAMQQGGFVVNKSHPGLIHYITEVVVPHWIEKWGLDGIYLDSPGMIYADLYIENLSKEIESPEGYEVLTPVNGYYSPELLVRALKEKIEQLEIETGKELIFAGESTFKTWRDTTDEIIIETLKGNPWKWTGSPDIDRSLGKYFEFVLDYRFRTLLKDIHEGGYYSYSENYVKFFELEEELDKKYTKLLRFVNMWCYIADYVDLLIPGFAENYVTLTVTSPGELILVGSYQLPPQTEFSSNYFGWNSEILRNTYKLTMKIKKNYEALQGDNIEDALISPKMKGVIAYNRWEGDESVTVVVNINDEPVNCKLRTRFKTRKVYDALSGELFEGSPENLEVYLPAFTPRILIEENPIQVEIEKPEERSFYLFDRKVSSFPFTLVIGGITIKPRVYSLSDVEKVEFYIDDDLKFVDLEEPYKWMWDELAIGEHEIKVIAYDVKGTNVSDKIEAWRIL